MKYIDEYRDPSLVRSLTAEIIKIARDMGSITLMEVCGTHTMAIFRYGIRDLLPQNIRLLSGPGCPVCVTPNGYLDKAIQYGRLSDVIVTTFGDMMRVPGSCSSLERERANGYDHRMVYSSMDALRIASENPSSRVIFLGIGFETTAPTIAASILEAKRMKLKNYSILCGHKLIPPVMEVVVKSEELRLNGFLCPAHVSTIIGSRPYQVITKRCGLPCVITGFEPLDILQGVLMLLKQIKEGKAQVEIQYRRVVTEEGNSKALRILDEVFEPCTSQWRGIGNIPDSGLKIKDSYREFDIESLLKITVEPPVEDIGCLCGQILRGVKTPRECRLFRKRCTPEHPVGACMVSSEGTCAAYYSYGK
jgi:hydrogenase expression/formation protein HypD